MNIIDISFQIPIWNKQDVSIQLHLIMINYIEFNLIRNIRIIRNSIRRHMKLGETTYFEYKSNMVLFVTPFVVH